MTVVSIFLMLPKIKIDDFIIILLYCFFNSSLLC